MLRPAFGYLDMCACRKASAAPQHKPRMLLPRYNLTGTSMCQGLINTCVECGEFVASNETLERGEGGRGL